MSRHVVVFHGSAPFLFSFLFAVCLGCEPDTSEKSVESTDDPTDSAVVAQDAKPTTSDSTATLDDVDRAKQVVSEFLAAVRAVDMDAMLQHCSVPFMGDGEQVETMEELREGLHSLIDPAKPLAEMTFEFHDAVSFDSVAEDLGADATSHFLKDNLVSGDQLIIFDIFVPGRAADRHGHWVHFSAGQAKIVGIRDMPRK